MGYTCLGSPAPPQKELGDTMPDPGKTAHRRLPPPGARPGSPPPPAARCRGWRSERPRAWYPEQPRLLPPFRLTSARAGSGPCPATGCGCSCCAGAGGSLFRWLRSSSGTGRTPATAHISRSSRTRSSRGADARPLPRAAAIPPTNTAAARGSVGEGQPRPSAAPQASPPPSREESAPWAGAQWPA